MSPIQTHAIRRRSSASAAMPRVLEWYFTSVFGTDEGHGVLPYYCDRRKVGAFAVSAARLASGDEVALFRLFVCLSMFQGIRDVVVMRHQRSLSLACVDDLAGLRSVEAAARRNGCQQLSDAQTFDERCDVTKRGGDVDCRRNPGRACHVKAATRSFHRMGDMGKLPTSAWLNVWGADGGVQALHAATLAASDCPSERATLLVQRFAKVHRVGRKLATMFVSALSTPALSNGVAPWSPEVDGNSLVVIDTNVARAVDVLSSGPRTYQARETWVLDQAAKFDLRVYRSDLPRFSPRLVQQALYSFCSRSNRTERNDACATRARACDGCARELCPFA